MIRVARRLAGLLAFLALTFSFTEAVWASTCAMPMPPAGVETTAGQDTPDAPRGMQCGSHGGDHEDHDRDTPCPFDSPGLAQTCTGVALLPSTSAALPAGLTSGMSAAFPVETRIGLLFEATLFRPPRA